MNVIIWPSSGLLEFNSLSAGSSSLDTTSSGVRIYFNTGSLRISGRNNNNLNRFEVLGNQGNLFSISDNMSGCLFAVNDFVGLPLVEVYNDAIKLGGFNKNDFVITGSNVGIGHSTPSAKLDVLGETKSWQQRFSGQSGDPRSYLNGDIWYNSRDNVLRTKWNANNDSIALGKTFATFKATDSYGVSSNGATTGIRNHIRMLEFDQTTAETGTFIDIVPSGICLNSGIIARLFWISTATTNNVLWSVAFEKMNTDLDVDSFDLFTSGVSAANSVAGVFSTGILTCTNIDSLRDGDPYRLRVVRRAPDVLDNMAADAQLILVELQAVL